MEGVISGLLMWVACGVWYCALMLSDIAKLLKEERSAKLKREIVLAETSCPHGCRTASVCSICNPY